ncbi:MAG: hypothetical protein FWD49_04960 [Firmicutes bacterium]|nr:hypothetical protein [Bacillota bacterium]
MANLRITLGKEEEAEKNYILERLSAYSGISTRVTNYVKFVAIDTEFNEIHFSGIIKDIISSVILIFYKYRVLSQGITKLDKNNITHYALLGALLSFDQDGEAVQVEKDLLGLTSVSVSTLYEFRHSKLKESWENIVCLANRLLTECSEEDDIYELIFFLLAVDPETAPKLKLETLRAPTKMLRLLTNNMPLAVPRLTNNPDYNAIIALVRERPSSIVITEPSTLNAGLLSAVKKLGS